MNNIRLLFGGTVAQFVVSTVHIANAWRILLDAFVLNAQCEGSPSYWDAKSPRPTQIICKSVVIINVSIRLEDFFEINLLI
jgi:hypothetical protein